MLTYLITRSLDVKISSILECFLQCSSTNQNCANVLESCVCVCACVHVKIVFCYLKYLYDFSVQRKVDVTLVQRGLE